MTPLISILLILAGAGFLWAIVQSLRVGRLKRSNTQMEAQLSRLNLNLYQLKTGRTKDSRALQSFKKADTRIKEAKSDEEAESIRRDIVSSIVDELQDYATNYSDITQ